MVGSRHVIEHMLKGYLQAEKNDAKYKLGSLEKYEKQWKKYICGEIKKALSFKHFNIKM